MGIILEVDAQRRARGAGLSEARCGEGDGLWGVRSVWVYMECREGDFSSACGLYIVSGVLR